jgi:uncharacterized protein (TIGR02678 family)
MSAVSGTEVAERRRALRALLARPLIAVGGAEAEVLPLIRRHAGWLRNWLMRHPGWALQVSSEHARLHKTPGRRDDGTRPARAPGSQLALSRRQYALLCLALAHLERADRQTLLGRLAEEVVALVAGDEVLAAAGFRFDLTVRDDRRDLVVVLRTLLEWRVLVRIDGDEQQFVGNAGAEVLYSVNRPVLAALLSVMRGPSTIPETGMEERLAALCEEPALEGEEMRNQRMRQRLVRCLLDDPVLYYEELDEAERAYLASQRPFLVAQIHEATGLVPEIRREGIAMVDERGELSDVRFPQEGTHAHAVLLLAEYLAGRLRAEPEVRLGLAELEGVMASAAQEHRRHWRKDATQPGAEVGLTRDALGALEALGLVRSEEEFVRPRPAVARFALQGGRTEGEGAR